MPTYPNNAFYTPKMLVEGWPEFLIGSFDTKQANGRMVITNVALASNVATLTVLILEGNIPAVGDLISTSGVSNSVFNNVANASITGVTITQSTGVGTITFALTHADVTSVAASGMAATLPQPTTESISGNYTSVPVTMQFGDPNTKGERTITVAVHTPTNSSLVATFTLQGALNDTDSEYTALSPIGTAITAVSVPTSANGTVTAEYCLTLYRFFRLKIAFTSGSGTMTARIMV